MKLMEIILSDVVQKLGQNQFKSLRLTLKTVHKHLCWLSNQVSLP
jgi:hypothetical protein